MNWPTKTLIQAKWSISLKNIVSQLLLVIEFPIIWSNKNKKVEMFFLSCIKKNVFDCKPNYKLPAEVFLLIYFKVSNQFYFTIHFVDSTYFVRNKANFTAISFCSKIFNYTNNLCFLLIIMRYWIIVIYIKLYSKLFWC